MQRVDFANLPPPNTREDLTAVAAWLAKHVGNMPTASEAHIAMESRCRAKYKKGWCAQTEAANELGVSSAHIRNCLADGRLREVVVTGLKRVDIESLIAYHADRARIDFKARITKRNSGKPPRFRAV